ncbi:MAG: hypothetical protein HYV60_14200, partial [Planctomycetia bacterium]|nr:hypothetical protein [Planctomycetia bacterium]
MRESFPKTVVLQLPEGLTQSLRVHWMIVAQIVVCAAPSMILLAVQQVRLASLAFYGPLAVLLAYHGLCGRTVRATAVVVGVMPLLAMMRGTLFHNSVAVILAMMIVHWFVFKNGDFLRMANNAMILGLLLASFGYWGASFLSTGLYHQNMRVFDLVFAAVLVSLLGHHRDYLASAFAGLAIAVVCVAIAVGISGGDRLGLTEIGDFSIGSPEQLAIPCVLVIILCFADEGRWILPGIPTVCRYLLSGVVASILLMTTSRTNWSLVLVAVLLLFFLQAGSRRQIIAGVVVLIIALAILLTTSRG